MALRTRSTFLYNYTVDDTNDSLDFKAASGGLTLTATIGQGNYSLTDLLAEIEDAMQTADPYNVYTVSANRTYGGNLQNRITIATSGTFLSLLFLTGDNTATTIAPLIGFATTDRTGATTYTGTVTTGTLLFPTWYAYSYASPTEFQETNAKVNISAAGVKETIFWAVFQYFTAQFKFETESKADTEWSPFLVWANKQYAFEFTPDVTAPNTVINCTLEAPATSFMLKEMLPDFPFLYDTGLMKFRVKVG